MLALLGRNKSSPKRLARMHHALAYGDRWRWGWRQRPSGRRRAAVLRRRRGAAAQLLGGRPSRREFSNASLDRDGGAGALEGGLRLLRGLLVDLLKQRLRRAVDQVLRLLEPKARQAANFLDDLDLLLAGRL